MEVYLKNIAYISTQSTSVLNFNMLGAFMTQSFRTYTHIVRLNWSWEWDGNGLEVCYCYFMLQVSQFSMLENRLWLVSWLSVIVTLTRPIRGYVYELDIIDVW